jgi:ABC-type branched-subunit amino acid transport system substrate-binding protein
VDLEHNKEDNVKTGKEYDTLQGLLSRPLTRRGFGLGVGRLGAGLAAASSLGTLSIGTARAAAFTGTRPYKIGFLAPLTGPVAPEGQSMQRGFDLAVETMNAAGGIAGQQIQVVSQDTQGAPAVAGTVVKKFIQEENVDLILGTITGDEEDVASALSAQAGVPILFPEHGFWHQYCNTTTVMMGENSFDLNGPLVPFIAEKFGKKFFLIGSDFSYPHAYLNVAKGYMKEAGVTVLDEVYAPLGTADWSSMIAKIKSAKPDVIYSAVVGGDAIAFVKQAESLGVLPGAHLTGDTLQAEFYPAMGSAIDGQYACVRYSEDIPTEANKKFIADYNKKYGAGPIPLVATTTYYSLDFIKAAVEKAGTYDRKAVFDAFKGLEVKTILSDKPIKIDPVTMNPSYPMYITQIQKGGLYKIVKEVGTVKNDLQCS